MIRFKITRNGRSMFAKGAYCKVYIKGETVESIPGTFGIVTFDTYINACSFLKKWKHQALPSSFFKIIKVKPIGRGKRVKFLSAGQQEWNIRSFYEHGIYKSPTREDLFVLLTSPKGTICYQSVEVLE